MNCDCCLSEAGNKFKQFAKTTPFTFPEVLRLLEKFKQLDEDHSGRVEFEELCRLPEMRSNPFARRLCCLFSEDGSQSLSFRQFVNLMGIFCERTSLQMKIIWAFAMWDFDGDDLLNARDIETGLRCISSLPIKASHDSPNARNELALLPHELAKVTEKVFHEVDPMDEGLSFNDFKSVVMRMPDFLANFQLTV